MGLPAQLKSKKVILGLGAVGLILAAFFLLRFMTSGGGDLSSEKSQPAPRTEKKISKPQKTEKKETTPTLQSPLFEALKSWKDPFREEDPKSAELQDKLELTKKEIEYLKATLEEKKLKKEIKELEESISGTIATSMPPTEAKAESPDGEKGSGESQKNVLVKAVLITDEKKSALLVFGDKEIWMSEGEEFDGWEIKRITMDSVVLLRAGKIYVLFCNRPGIVRKGES